MANPNLMHEGNEGCFKIHRNKTNFELKFAKNKSLYILAKSEDFSLMDNLRFALYKHYGAEVLSVNKMESIEVKRVAERLMPRMSKGELEKIMDKRVEFHKGDRVKDLVGSKIVIRKEKEKYPIPGDFIILTEGNHNHLGIVAGIKGTDYFVFIETGGSILMDDIGSDWCFATATVEAI